MENRPKGQFGKELEGGMALLLGGKGLKAAIKGRGREEMHLRSLSQELIEKDVEYPEGCSMVGGEVPISQGKEARGAKKDVLQTGKSPCHGGIQCHGKKGHFFPILVPQQDRKRGFLFLLGGGSARVGGWLFIIRTFEHL